MEAIRDRETPQFLTRLVTTDIEGSDDEAQLVLPLAFYSARLRRVIVAPAGFRTDFASIPRVFWRVLRKRGKHDRGAVLHDAGYRGELLDLSGAPLALSKDDCDAVFLEAMLARGVRPRIAELMHGAVVRFGGASYKGCPATR